MSDLEKDHLMIEDLDAFEHNIVILIQVSEDKMAAEKAERELVTEYLHHMDLQLLPTFV